MRMRDAVPGCFCYAGMSFATSRCGWLVMRRHRVTAERSSQSGRSPRSYALLVVESMSWDRRRIGLVWLAIGAWYEIPCDASGGPLRW